MLISDSKYGYRGTKEGLSLTLIRSSVDPDPWPEVGEHRIQMAIALNDNRKSDDAATAQAFCRKLIVSAARAHKGNLPVVQSMMEFMGEGIVLSSVKMAEDGSGIVVRYYEIEGKSGRGEVRFLKAPKDALAVNVLEQPIEGLVQINAMSVSFDYRAYSIGNMLIKF